MQDSVTPMVSAVLGAVINILLNIILSKYMGLAGLALATSISNNNFDFIVLEFTKACRAYPY